MYTALHRRPLAPVCLVTSLCPIIWSANIFASVGLEEQLVPIASRCAVANIRIDHSDTTFQPVVEGTLASTSSEDLGFDNHVITTWSQLDICPQNISLSYVPIDLATASASAADLATSPLGTPMPY